MKKTFPSLFKRAGFTLVELLVVIGIIGVLSSIVYANFGEARKAARDDVRSSELKELQLAVELYKAQNGQYPSQCSSGQAWSGSVPGSFSCSNSSEGFILGLVPDFIDSLPTDPKSTGNSGYIYRVNAVGTEYKLMANGTVESKLVDGYTHEFARCPQSNGTAYCGVSGPPMRTYAVYKGATAQGW